MSNLWTRERIELLVSMFSLGFLMDKMASTLNVTRNAVIGKCNRLGLKRRQPRANDEPKKPRAKKLRDVDGDPFVHSKRKAPIVVDPPCDVDGICDLIAEISPTAISLIEIGHGQCRWPLGGLMMCGRPSLQACSYCAGHARLAYRGASGPRARGYFRIAQGR